MGGKKAFSYCILISLFWKYGCPHSLYPLVFTYKNSLLRYITFSGSPNPKSQVYGVIDSDC